MKRGERLFYVLGGFILVLTAWNFFTVPWHALTDEPGFSILLNLIVSMSLGVTEIAVGWLVGLHLEEEQL